MDAHPTMEVWPRQLKTHRDLTNKKWGFTGQRGLLEGISNLWGIYFLADLHPSEGNGYNNSETNEVQQKAETRWTPRATGRERRRARRRQRRGGRSTRQQSKQQVNKRLAVATPGSCEFFLLHLRSRVGLYTILGDGGHTTMRIPKSGGISMLDT